MQPTPGRFQGAEIRVVQDFAQLGGQPPVERGEGPNSGPESRELEGWMIRLVLPNGFSGSARLAR